MYYFSPLLLSEYLFLVLLMFVTAENLAIGSQQGENPQHEWEWGGGHSWPASSLPWVLALDSSSPEVPLWEPCHGLTLYRQLFWVQMACLICQGSNHHTYVASPPWKSPAWYHCIWASFTSVDRSHCSHIPDFGMVRQSASGPDSSSPGKWRWCISAPTFSSPRKTPSAWR